MLTIAVQVIAVKQAAAGVGSPKTQYIGRDLDRARGQAFPCLYIAADVETAYGEYFGAPLDSHAGGLSLQELALRRQTSFTTFALAGALEHVFDLRSQGPLGRTNCREQPHSHTARTTLSSGSTLMPLPFRQADRGVEFPYESIKVEFTVKPSEMRKAG